MTRASRSAGAAALRVARLLTLLALTCGAARAEYILLPPPDTAVAGGPISLVLMIANDTDQPVEVDIPLRLDLRLTTDTEAFNASLTADPPPVPGRIELAPRTFRKIRYSGELPDKLQGAVTLRVRELETNSLMLAVSREPQQEPGTVIAAQPAIAAERPSSPFLSALSTYDPVYFALGTRGETNAKFQLSFKFQFFAQDAPLVRYANFLQDIYFGYTQTTIWNIGSASAPFYDTSYQPRVFYLNEDAWDWPGRKVMLGVESGLGHESNGKSGADSRSINIAYIKPIFTFGDRHDWHLRIEPMLIDYLQDSENPDIADYRGYVDLKAIFGKEDSWQIQGLFRKGSQGFSAQIDVSYPLRAVALGNLNGYFLVQYFDGYGESILDYNRRLPSQLRLGLMVVR